MARLTVRELLDGKGRRRFTFVQVTRAEEAVAAAEAGMDMIGTGWIDGRKEIAGSVPETHFAYGLQFGHHASSAEALRAAFSALAAGADSIYSPMSPNVIEVLAREGIPIIAHVGLVPPKATWTGGGYIGLEAAAAARARGCVVTVLEAASLVMNRVVAPEIGRFYEDLHRANGVDIRTDVKVLEFIGDGRIEAVVCKGGITLPADFVIVGVGVEADAGLAQAAGLVVDNGIVVDSYGRSSDEHIFAAGDVANQPSDLLGRRLRLESWQNAQNQSIAVARIMCGGSEPYQELPWFWSDQYGLNLQMIGLPEGWDRLVIRGDMATQKFAAFYLRDRAIIGANAVNSPRDLRFARMLMEQGARPDPAALADQNIPLKSLLDV